MELFTIGAYGATADGFFRCLTGAGVDTFVDIRQRRGMRGKPLAFANSSALQTRLAALGIRYLHLKELAPSSEIRQLQKRSDDTAGIGKYERRSLSPAFVHAYHSQRLAHFGPDWILSHIGPDARRVVFFCVERDAESCHRSLVAERLSSHLSRRVTHLLP
jgi:uncharacterized protein (DUF488 family)